LTKHQIALLIIYGRPRKWGQIIHNYISSLPKESFFLYDVVVELRTQYLYAFVNETELQEIGYMIKKGLAKHTFGDEDHWIDKIKLITNANLPKREDRPVNDDQE
jgi:hypothetical protein